MNDNYPDKNICVYITKGGISRYTIQPNSVLSKEGA